MRATKPRRALGLDPARTVVVFFGKVLEYKGVDLLLDAIGALPPEVAIDVLVVGLCRDEELRRDLEARAAWAGERVRTRFEFVPDAELAVYLTAADFAVFPFRAVTNSSSVATALGAGLPVIVPRLATLDDLPDDATVRYEPGLLGLIDALHRAVALPPPARCRPSRRRRAVCRATNVVRRRGGDATRCTARCWRRPLSRPRGPR